MPRVIEATSPGVSTLEELIERIDQSKFDPTDEESFCTLGDHLKELHNNRRFLGDLAIAELKERCSSQERNNQYGPQVIMLHRADKYFLRANVWPSPNDDMFKTSGPDPFFYYFPHDHNFNFLTVGYWGPGYWSDYYEYNYDEVVGNSSEPIDLRFVETSKLDTGKVMLYRAHRDIHRQLPPDALSISINIMEATDRQSFTDQYRFDIPTASVSGMLTFTALESLVDMAAQICGESGSELLSHMALHHPSERIQARAIRAQAGAAKTHDAAVAILERGLRSGKRFVQGFCRSQLEVVNASKSWIAKSVPQGDVLRHPSVEAI